MGIGKSNMCSCTKFEIEEEKKQGNYKNFNFGPEEGLKFTEVGEPKQKSNDTFETRASSIFTSRNN